MRTDDFAPHSLNEMTDQQLDALDFGVIEFDDDGNVLRYNAYESALSGFARDDVIGRSFFRSVAPCTNNDTFRMPFEAGKREGDLDELFQFTFTYKLIPCLVRLRMLRLAQRNWLLVSPINEE